jgi:hypothetical protein
MAGGAGTKEIATRYPLTRGLIARTTSQTGDEENLIPEEGSLVPHRFREGL